MGAAVGAAGAGATLARVAAGGFSSAILAAASPEEGSPAPPAPGSRGLSGIERLSLALAQAGVPPLSSAPAAAAPDRKSVV